jgi:DNA polymerase III subunit epsilon
MMFDTDNTKFSHVRIIEIAWEICSSSKEIVTSLSFLIKPNGFTIPPDVTEIHHITNEDAMAHGILITDALTLMTDQMRIHEVSTIVTYNTKFDLSVILNEMRLNNLSSLIDPFFAHCIHDPLVRARKLRFTFEDCTDQHNLPRDLHSVYYYLFNQACPWPAHHAINDVKACREIYHEMINRFGIKRFHNLRFPHDFRQKT